MTLGDDTMEDKSSLTFSFCGDYEVNALSLANTITSLVEISTAVAEREFPNVHFRMSVRAITPGSLRFDFLAAVIPSLVSLNLFSSDKIEYASNLIDLISNAFSIKKFLKNKFPKKKEQHGEKIVITNADGKKMEIPIAAGVYFIDPRIDNSITKIINTAKESDGTTGISVSPHSSNHSDMVQINREDFEDCSVEIPIPESEEKTIVSIRRNEVLYVRQADFYGGLKWRFKGDQNIVAEILDEEFKKKVQSGAILFGSKTYIIADVQVTVTINSDGAPNTSKPTYEILKVHEIHTVAENQLKLDI